jgi:hypothetical protein
MTITREKFRDGVFVGERIVSLGENPTPEDIEEGMSEIFDPFTPEKVMEELEKEIAGIIIDASSSKVRISNAQAALFRLEEVKKNLVHGNVSDIFINTIHLMESLWKAKIRPFEKVMFAKAKYSKGGMIRGQEKTDLAKTEHERIRAIAKTITGRHTKSNIARILKSKYGVKLTTRQISTILTQEPDLEKTP